VQIIDLPLVTVIFPDQRLQYIKYFLQQLRRTEDIVVCFGHFQGNYCICVFFQGEIRDIITAKRFWDIVDSQTFLFEETEVGELFLENTLAEIHCN
jgi:hypothetical protein